MAICFKEMHSEEIHEELRNMYMLKKYIKN